jgi:DNA segregation ATPase FtsK/SpoIIIE-like protein
VQRVYAPFVTEAEIVAIVEFPKNSFCSPGGSKNIGSGSFVDSSDDPQTEGDNELYQDALRVILEADTASTSPLQHRPRIG